jgi:hypothetical protein
LGKGQSWAGETVVCPRFSGKASARDNVCPIMQLVAVN